MHAVMSEWERDQTDAFAAKLSTVLCGFKAAGMTQRQMVIQLNALEIPAARGGLWSLAQLQRVMGRRVVQ